MKKYLLISALSLSIWLGLSFTLLPGNSQAQSGPSQGQLNNRLTPPTQAPLPAKLILSSAEARAAAEHKNVLIIFHASWCGWCKKMDASIQDPVCKAYFDKNFVIEHLTVMENGANVALENPGAQQMLETYGGAESGIPYWLIFSPDGKLLADSKFHTGNTTDKENGQNMGCPAQPAEVDYFIGVLKKTSQLSQEQAAAVKARFLKNAPATS